MERTITSGLVERIEPIHKFLSFVTLAPIDASWTQSKVPVYMPVDSGYIGKPVDIIMVTKGRFWKVVDQTVQSANRSDSVTMPYSMVRQINNNYRRAEALAISRQESL